MRIHICISACWRSFAAFAVFQFDRRTRHTRTCSNITLEPRSHTQELRIYKKRARVRASDTNTHSVLVREHRRRFRCVRRSLPHPPTPPSSRTAGRRALRNFASHALALNLKSGLVSGCAQAEARAEHAAACVAGKHMRSVGANAIRTWSVVIAMACSVCSL